jgi:hypothetical protein
MEAGTQAGPQDMPAGPQDVRSHNDDSTQPSQLSVSNATAGHVQLVWVRKCAIHGPRHPGTECALPSLTCPD